MSRIRVLPLCSAVALALPLCVSAADSKDASDATALSNEGLRLRLSRGLNEQAPTERDEAPTYLSAYRMVGRTNEKIELYDDAEVRRGGAVLRGDTITYTFSTDEVYSKGNALVARNGTVFKGPELTYRLDAETGEMPDATFRYLPNEMRGTSDKVELLGGGRAKMCNAVITTCREGEEAWWITADSVDYDQLDESAVGRNATLYLGGVPIFASPYFTSLSEASARPVS